MAIYDEAVKLAMNYIGPMGQKFIDRQLEFHLKIGPAELTADKLVDLSKWCSTSGGLLIGDKQAAEFGDKIKVLK
jgi:hypothetical protein